MEIILVLAYELTDFTCLWYFQRRLHHNNFSQPS